MSPEIFCFHQNARPKSTRFRPFGKWPVTWQPAKLSHAYGSQPKERQKQFVTNAGHEIKTPLAIIQSNTEALELYQGESKWSKNIKDQTVRLGGLMRDLLTLARMDEGVAQAQPAEMCLSEKLEALLEAFLPPIEGKKVRLQKNLEPDISLFADPIQTEQILSVLVDNAVKYVNEGGYISVCLKRREKICLQIRNSCEQLPQVPPEKLFDRFYRADASRTQKNGGYGIGLAIASSLATANKWELHASYMGPNEVCFTICF